MNRLTEMPSVPFSTARRRFLYGLLLCTFYHRILACHLDTPWRALLSLYGGISPNYIGDLGWRLLHAAVPHNCRIHWFTGSEAFPFCGLAESIDHVYVSCLRLHSLFVSLKNLLLMFCLHFSPTLLIYRHLVRRREGRDGNLLMNLLLGLARCAIYILFSTFFHSGKKNTEV